MSDRPVVLVLPDLMAGGAQRQALLLAESLGIEEIALVLLTDRPDELMPPTDLRVFRLGFEPQFGVWAKARNVIQLLLRLRRQIAALEPAVVVGMLDTVNVRVSLAMLGSGIRVICRVATDPLGDQLTRLEALLRWLLYPRASAVVMQAEEYVVSTFWARRSDCVVIPNGVKLHPTRADLARKQITAVGRLEPEKEMHIVIDAFAGLAPDFPNWSVTIAGEGSCRTALEQQTTRRALDEQVRLPGVSSETASLLGRTSIFVLTSRYEGMPNALMEAMSMGVPSIATDSSAGVRLLLRSGGGYLVPVGDVHAIRTRLRELMEDPAVRHRLGEEARVAVEEFDVDTLASRWRLLIERVGRC